MLIPPFVWLWLIAIEFEINEECKGFLKSLTGPIGVISVAGMYRSGKSYLLNRVLLNRSRGFDVGHTINACTKVSPRSILYHFESDEASWSLDILNENNSKKWDAGLLNLRLDEELCWHLHTYFTWLTCIHSKLELPIVFALYLNLKANCIFISHVHSYCTFTEMTIEQV